MERVGESVYTLPPGRLHHVRGRRPAVAHPLRLGTADAQRLRVRARRLALGQGHPGVPVVAVFAARHPARSAQTGFLFPTFGVLEQRACFTRDPVLLGDRRQPGPDGGPRRLLRARHRPRRRTTATSCPSGTAGPVPGSGSTSSSQTIRDGSRAGSPGTASRQAEWTPAARLQGQHQRDQSDDHMFRDYGDRLAERGREQAEPNLVRLPALGRVEPRRQRALVPGPHHDAGRSSCSGCPRSACAGSGSPCPACPLLCELESSFVNFVREVGPGRAPRRPPSRGSPAASRSPAIGHRDARSWGGAAHLLRPARHRRAHHPERADSSSRSRCTTTCSASQVELGSRPRAAPPASTTLDGLAGLAALQHAIEPLATFIAVRGIRSEGDPAVRAGGEPDRLLRSLDPNIDRLGKVNAVKYSLTNRINAKTTAGPEPGGGALGDGAVDPEPDLRRRPRDGARRAVQGRARRSRS